MTSRRYLEPRSGGHPYDHDDGATPPHIFYVTVDMIPREAWHPDSPMRKHLHTPNLDRLMADGATFSHACCNSPLCGPSRAGTLTGRYSYLLVNEERAHDGMEVLLRADDAIFPEYLRDTGWITKHSGKCHVGAHKFIDAFGEADDAWDRWAPPLTDDDGYLGYLRELGVMPPEWREPVRGVRPGGDPGNNYGGWVTQEDGSEFPEEATYCQYLAWLAAERLQNALYQRTETWAPIYLQLDFFAPHQPFIVPESYRERARELAEHVELPESYHRAVAGEIEGLPRVYEFYRKNWGLDDPQTARQYMLMNFLQIEALDAAVGRFLGELDRHGLYDEALVIFAADHGEMNCELALVDKGVYGCPKTAQVPLVAKLPGGEAAGTRYDELVTLLDIAPTVLELAGVEPAERLDGESLLPLIRGERAGRERPFIFEAGWHVAPNPAVSYFAEIDEQLLMYTYNLTSDFDELYDLDARPMRNMAGDEAMVDVKREMIRRLGAFLQADPRWNCYWHTFRLDHYELLELDGGDFQMFRPE
ncbi:MAG: sulfatase-like hydrolase/transferase [Armatimonadota bacterium]